MFVLWLNGTKNKKKHYTHGYTTLFLLFTLIIDRWFLLAAFFVLYFASIGNWLHIDLFGYMHIHICGHTGGIWHKIEYKTNKIIQITHREMGVSVRRSTCIPHIFNKYCIRIEFQTISYAHKCNILVKTFRWNCLSKLIADFIINKHSLSFFPLGKKILQINIDWTGQFCKAKRSLNY